MQKKLIIIVLLILALAIGIELFMMATNSRASYVEATEKFYESLTAIHLPIDINVVKERIEEILNKEWNEEQAEEEEEEEEEEEWEEEDTIIYLDAGHGCTSTDKMSGTAVGTRCTGITDPKEGDTLYEYENSYRTALHVKDALEDAGYKVKMSRNTEEQDPNAPGNYKRGQEAAECDGAVVIHYNGGAAGHIWFFGVYPSGYNYNQNMLSTFITELSKHQKRTKTQDVYTKSLNLISGYSKAGGDPQKILYIECGEMDGPSEHQKWLASDQGQKEMAEAIVAAIKVGVPKKQKKVEHDDEEGGEGGGNTITTTGDECKDAYNAIARQKGLTLWDDLDTGMQNALREHYSHYGTAGW